MSAEDAKDLTTLVTPRRLRGVAGERFFGRGEAYFTAGAVRSLRRRRGGVEAVVQGTRRYRVRLWGEDGDLAYDCTCPVGQDGEFCKHCVAVGLASQADAGGGDAAPGEDGPPSLTERDVRDYLVGLDKEELVSMLLDQSAEDQRLHRRLVVRAAHATGGTADLSVWKDALDDAVQAGDFVPYREAYDYASGVEEVIDGLEDLLREGQAESVIELAEHGLAAVDESLEQVDDSDGWMGGLLGRLQELHLEACRQARPDPANLAQRMFELEMGSVFDTFGHAFVAYADILGEAGLAAYRRLAEAEWAKVPAVGPGEGDRGRYGGRFRITSIMEEMARADGDLEARVAVKSRDLSSPYDFLQIAELYRDAGDPDRALDWAERGWRAFPDKRRDGRLRVFIADAYQCRGRHDEAMTLVWEAFAESPHLESYRQLEQRAGAAGQGPAWRDRALSLIRERIADKAAEPPGHRLWMPGPSRDHSLLVEIFLHEGDSDGAWHEAETGGCSEDLWLALAKRRETSHPADSVRVYKGHVASLLRNTGDRVYEEAVGTLEKIRKLLARSGQEAAFRPLLTEVRATHRRKRNLMKMLDRKGW